MRGGDCEKKGCGEGTVRKRDAGRGLWGKGAGTDAGWRLWDKRRRSEMEDEEACE